MRKDFLQIPPEIAEENISYDALKAQFRQFIFESLTTTPTEELLQEQLTNEFPPTGYNLDTATERARLQHDIEQDRATLARLKSLRASLKLL